MAQYTKKQKEIMGILFERCIEVIEKSNEIFPKKIALTKCTFDFTLKGKVAGRAQYKPATDDVTLKFNLQLAIENLDEFLVDTVPHEITHIYVKKMYPWAQPHGKEFHQIMAKMGYSPKRCHSYDVSNTKQKRRYYRYVYKCGCETQHYITSNKHYDIQKYLEQGHDLCRCNKCKKIIVFTGKTQYIYK